MEKTDVLRSGRADGQGALWRSTWKGVLPYVLEFEFELVQVERP